MIPLYQGELKMHMRYVRPIPMSGATDLETRTPAAGDPIRLYGVAGARAEAIIGSTQTGDERRIWTIPRETNNKRSWEIRCLDS